MYTVSPDDLVEELADVPQSCTGAPMPVIIADEHHLLLAYLTSQPDPKWDGTYVNVVTGDTKSVAAIVAFARPSLHMFGPPNDEAFGGHPLARNGLRPYSANEIHNSSWRQRMIEMNRVHHRHSDCLFDAVRHFIFAFHDSTFECLAHSYEVSLFRGSMHDATAHMSTLAKEW